MNRFLMRAAIAAFGLWLAAQLVPGLYFDNAGWLLVAAVVLGLVNAVVRPIAMLLTFPFLIVTLGLFLLVVNAAMLYFTAWLLAGFHVAGFGDAFWGALIVSLVSWAGSMLLGPRPRIDVTIHRE